MYLRHDPYHWYTNMVTACYYKPQLFVKILWKSGLTFSEFLEEGLSRKYVCTRTNDATVMNDHGIIVNDRDVLISAYNAFMAKHGFVGFS